MNTVQAAGCLESLGNEKRLTVFRALVRAGPEGLAVGQLQDKLRIPASTLSHHVAHLVSRELIVQSREGRVLRCVANYRKMDALMGFLTRECCADVGGCA